MTTQDRTFWTHILPLSVFRLKILIYMYIYYKYIDNVYCCYIKRHYLKQNECATGVWNGNVSVVFCIWVELVRRNLLFYITLHWMLVCCGHEYLKYLLVRKIGDHNFIEQYSRSWTHLQTLTEESEKKEWGWGDGRTPVVLEVNVRFKNCFLLWHDVKFCLHCMNWL